MIDIESFVGLHKLQLPETLNAKIKLLKQYDLIQQSEAGGWDIFNFAALLYARRLRHFPSLTRKALRVIRYTGKNNTATHHEQEGRMGYAVAFERIIKYVEKQLPRESIDRALRKDEPMYPAVAIRELLANTLIHQDFNLRGMGPLLEIYDNRIEFTNPGEPLIDTDRFLDSPARSRNEILAKQMRLIGICEERGSGIDKVVNATEIHQPPSPKFQVTAEATVATLFAPKPLADMDSEERIRACYMHASLKHVEQDYMTNASLRARFKLSAKESAVASRVIGETLDDGKIKLYDPTVGYKARKYSPYWA